MFARLGRVLNWTGRTVASPFVALGLWVIFRSYDERASFIGVMALVIAIASCAVGWTSRYARAGRRVTGKGRA